jgi:hypothetical protein
MAQVTLQQVQDVGLSALTKKLMLFHAIDAVRNAARIIRLAWKERLFPKEWAEKNTPKNTEERPKKDAAYWRNKIESMYRTYNPKRLDELDEVLKKYNGLEEELYESLSDKYNHKIEVWKRKIEVVHHKYNPVPNQAYLDKLFEKYEGPQPELYWTKLHKVLCDKYNHKEGDKGEEPQKKRQRRQKTEEPEKKRQKIDKNEPK